MKWTVVGLGNPGDEYRDTRHNVGWHIVRAYEEVLRMGGFVFDTKVNAEVASAVIGSRTLTLVLPYTFMNKSGTAVKPFVKNKKAAERLIVVHDDIDLPLGTIRLSFGRGSAGQKGVDSIIKALGTKDFIRMRVGIAETTPAGVLKKPKGEQKVIDFVLGAFRSKEEPVLADVTDRCVKALAVTIADGHECAMNMFN